MVFVTFLIAATKHLARATDEEKRCVLPWGFRGHGLSQHGHCGRVHGRGSVQTGLLLSITVREQHSFPPLDSFWVSDSWGGAASIQSVFSLLSYISLESLSQTYPELCLLGYSKACQADSEDHFSQLCTTEHCASQNDCAPQKDCAPQNGCVSQNDFAPQSNGFYTACMYGLWWCRLVMGQQP